MKYDFRTPNIKLYLMVNIDTIWCWESFLTGRAMCISSLFMRNLQSTRIDASRCLRICMMHLTWCVMKYCNQGLSAPVWQHPGTLITICAAATWKHDAAILPHTLHSPNLASCSFYLFPLMKGRHFKDAVDVWRLHCRRMHITASRNVSKNYVHGHGYLHHHENLRFQRNVWMLTEWLAAEW
jgi:hypothetical protein